LQHVGDVAGHLHLVPDATDDALAVDEEGGALHAHVFAAVHALLDPGPVSFGRLAVGVAGERERQRMLLLELVMAGDTVARYADDGGVDAAKVRHVIAEVASLLGAAGRIVLRIEVENDAPAGERRQRDRAATVGRHAERWRPVADLQFLRRHAPLLRTVRWRV